jgi:polar amino acid transport system substrate-binding protein
MAFPGVASAATLEEIRQRGYMVVATQVDCPPFEYVVSGQLQTTHEPRDVPAGYDNDLLTALRKTAGFAIRQEIVPWPSLLAGVAAGRYDAALTAAVITERDAQTVDFTIPVADATMAYVKRKGDFSIRSVADLAGKTLGVQEAGASLAVLPQLAAQLKTAGGSLGNIVQFTSYAAAYEALVSHRVDAVINNHDSLAQLVSETAGLLELGGRVGARSYAAWAVAKGNRGLRDFLNDYLERQKANGTVRRLQVKYDLTFVELPDRPLLPGGRTVH